MTLRIDLITAETAPFEGSEGHALLGSIVGLWRGSTRLWLDPAAPPEESLTALSAELLLGGRWLRMSYQGTSFGKPHAGEMLWGYHKDVQQFELAWVDSAHTGSAIMFSSGRAERPRVLDVLGSYVAGDQRWGWRSVLECPSPDELVMHAFNISPQGVEERAIESRFTRL